MINSDARALQYLACSAGVFLGRANFFQAKPHVKIWLEKRGENGASQKERGKGREERKHCENEKHPLMSRGWPLFRKWEADQSTPKNDCTGSSLDK